MAKLNGSDQFSNVTNHTFYAPAAFCTGPEPSKTVIIITFSLLMTFSLIGNLFVVAVFYRNKTLRTAVHYFIVNMAISDLIFPMIILPWRISHIYHDDQWLVDGVLGTVLCKLVGIAWDVPTFVFILSMLAIAADRFRAVLFPMKSALFSRNKRRLIIVATWIASVAFRSHHLYAAKLVSYGTKLYCEIQWEPASQTREMLGITWISSFCLTCVSAIVLTVLYSSIIISLHRQKNNLHLATEVIKSRAKENRQVTSMLVVIVVVFYVAWIPFHVAYFTLFLKPSIRLPCFFLWLADNVLPPLYPVVNPVVYYTFNANYHQGFRELLCCPWPCPNKCKDCFQSSVTPQGENNVHNAEQVNNAMNENIELHEQ